LKEAWVHLEEWSKAMVTTALEGGADALILPYCLQDTVKALGLITTVSPDGDLKPGILVNCRPAIGFWCEWRNPGGILACK
jgi:3-dehydroquinate synthase class II